MECQEVQTIGLKLSVTFSGDKTVHAPGVRPVEEQFMPVTTAAPQVVIHNDYTTG